MMSWAGKFLFRIGQFAALAAMAVLGLFDMATWLSSSRPFYAIPETALAIAIAAVWLPAHPQDTRQLPKRAIGLALVSLSLVYIEAQTGGWSASWGLAETGGMLGLLLVVARRSDRTIAGPASGAVAIAIIAQPLSLGSDDYQTTIILIMAHALLATFALVAGAYMRMQESSRERQLETVRAEQRAEFARDLHDFIAHHVTGIVVQAQGARVIAEHDPQRVVTALEQIEQAGAETMASMRRMVGVLRAQPDASPDGSGPAPLAPLAGVAELGPLVESFTAAGGPEARLHLDGDLDDLPIEVTSSAYRVVMEALTNVRRHAADATVVDVWIRRTPEWLLVRVANDGHPPRTGVTRELRGGFGLVGLTERLSAVGGRIQAGPGIDGGWVVDAGLPLNQPVPETARMSG
jgi:signal transduction histidine kinase